MVIYFTGTGNSQYVAEAIADRLDDEIVRANDYIKEKKTGSFRSVKPFVFVFPVYLSTIAELFADFIRASEFTTKDGHKAKAYFIATCASEMGASANACKKLSENKHLEYMGIYKLQMPQNYITFFKMTEPEECERRQKKALVSADEICEIIKNGELLDTSLKSGLEYAGTCLVEKIYNGPFTRTKKFYATDECVGCGICEKNCPLNRITMVDGKPKWTGSCVHCMGCINRCPKKAIEYGKKTIGKTRYFCKSYKS